MSESTMALLRTALSLLTAIVTLITPIVVWRLNKKQGKKIDAVQTKVGGVETKLDENHKLMNGNIDKLMKSTADLATANEKAREKGEDKKGPGL